MFLNKYGCAKSNQKHKLSSSAPCVEAHMLKGEGERNVSILYPLLSSGSLAVVGWVVSAVKLQVDIVVHI